MLSEYKTQTNIGVGVGFLSQAIGMSVDQPNGGIGVLFVLVGSALFIWGCVSYAKGKGQSPFLGILGLLSIFGLIVLALLPDHFKDGTPRESHSSGVSSDASINALERLATLREKGLLTADEFEKKKRALL